MSKQDGAERLKREQRLEVVLEYLLAIQAELEDQGGRTSEWKM
jgi:hypothetical protein